MKENVNHPSHYNQHPAGIECIDIIRHYTCDIANAIKYLWRAGLKAELGKDDADKEIEDLKKALWYIENYRIMIPKLRHFNTREEMSQIVIKVTGYAIEQIWQGFDPTVAAALDCLLSIGIVYDSEVHVCEMWEWDIRTAKEAVENRIMEIDTMLTNKELQSTIGVMQGQAVDGDDYVSKPGGKRETEPDKYDPLNMLVIQGRAYCLTDEKREKPNGALYSPCDNCAMREECLSYDGSEQMKNLCGTLHYATDQQYYREVGYCKYRPSFGTIEVIDEMKESEKELRELEEEE